MWTLPAITDTSLPTNNSGSNGSNGSNGHHITANTVINDIATGYARATAMDDNEAADADEYRKATRGE